jgi:hypothetical protein
MAVRKMTMKAWANAIDAAGPDSPDLQGDSPGGVAARLGCSRQAVHRLIQRGTLDAVAVYEGKRVAFYVVTEASLRVHQQRLAERLSGRLARVLATG